MQKTKIEWVKNPDGSQGFTSNPISGLCPVGCKLPDGRIYCYGRNYYKRFKSRKWFMDGRPMFWVHRLAKIQKRKKPAGIFMCSTFELFYSGKEFDFARENVFKTIEACPQHRFYILTKFPQNIDRPMPSNVWLGCTITGEKGSWERSLELKKVKAKLKFISYEPMLEQRIFDWEEIDWLIIGRLTGYGKKYDPPKDWIESRVRVMRNRGIPIFLKDNLKEIWEEPLIQEFPK